MKSAIRVLRLDGQIGIRCTLLTLSTLALDDTGCSCCCAFAVKEIPSIVFPHVSRTHQAVGFFQNLFCFGLMFVARLRLGIGEPWTHFHHSHTLQQHVGLKQGFRDEVIQS